MGLGSRTIEPLVDMALLPEARADDTGRKAIRAAHRWYEHLISLWAPGLIEAAHDLGVFRALSRGPLSGAGLAATLKTDPRATGVLMDGLYAYDLIERTTDASGTPVYTLPDAAAECLLPEGLYSLTGKIEYDRLLAWDAWRNLADSVRSGARDAAGRERPNQISESEYGHLVQGINFWAPPIVDILADELEGLDWQSGQPRRLLDVGCGTGLYSHLLLNRFPALTATGLDVASIAPLARSQAERLGVADRFETTVLDFQQQDWGTGFDLVFFANIFHLQTPDGALGLARRASAALSEGGLVAIADHIVDDLAEQSVQNRFFRLFAVSMLATGGGGAYTLDDYDTWLDEAGLKRVALLDSPMHRVLLASKS